MNITSIADRVLKAVRHIKPLPEDMLPSHTNADDAYNVQCCMYDPVGYAYINQFERLLVEYTGLHVTACSSGTAALHLALLVVGVKPGDYVIVPAMTYAAAAAAVRYCGARPIFVDCNLEPFGRINAFKLRQVFNVMGNEMRTVKALIAVDLLGYPGTSPDIEEICRQYGIPIVEDAAAALGSCGERWRWRIGEFSDVATISFAANKIVTTGMGGAVVSKRIELVERAKHLATTAKKPVQFHYDHDAVGYNYCMGNINAAMGLAQLQRLDKSVARKRDLHGLYVKHFDKELAGDVGIVRCDEALYGRPNHWLNALMIDARHAAHYSELREAILLTLDDAGYGCRAMYTPLHMQSPYIGFPSYGCDVAMDIYWRTVCLPSGITT